MARIILTGSTGFVGRHVLEALLEDGHMVLAPVRRAKDLADYKGIQGLVIREGVFYTKTMLQTYEQFQPDMIMHFAALKEGRHSKKDYHSINVRGTELLAQFALREKLDRFVFCSTVGIYGTVPGRIPADAWTPASPDNEFQRSKFRAEKSLVNILRNQVPFVILRPTVAYGEGDAGFVYKLANLIRKRRIPLVNDQVHIHLLDVQMIAELIKQIIHVTPEEECILNLADKKPVLLDKIVSSMHRHYHGAEYPGYLIWPPKLYSIGSRFGSILNMDRLQNQSQLLSNSWYYDTSNLEAQFSIVQRDTLPRIKHYLREKVFD
ncbi:MAG: NAD-dependent epimerase/dehydratase family protein [Calditrichota bacterium]